MTRARLVATAGVLLALAGVALFWWTNVRAGAGAVAYRGSYEPLSAYESTLTLQFDDAPFVVSWEAGHLIGLALLVGGLLALAGVLGFRLGRRGRTS